MCCLSIRWFGKCWHIHNMLKYEFDIEFDVRKVMFCQMLYWLNVLLIFCEQIAVTYPATAPEVAIPELDGKTAKMYRYDNCNALCMGKFWSCKTFELDNLLIGKIFVNELHV